MPVITRDMVPVMVATGASSRVDLPLPARFQPGDRVRARNANIVGHTRLTRYVRGHVGTIILDHGVFTLPDTMAHGQGEGAQHTYAVRFTARELWGDAAPAHDSVTIDLFESYLDPA